MKVYLAVSNFESVRGAFSTEKKAQKFIEYRIHTTRYKKWIIEEFEVDEKEVK